MLTKEAELQMRLTLRHPDEARHIPIPQFSGFCTTAKGLGALWELIGDGQGGMGQTLREVCADGTPSQILTPLNEFCTALFRFGIVAPDLHAGNLVLDHRTDTARFYLVDGFGDRNVIPLRSLASRANTRSLNKQLQTVAQEVGAKWLVDARRFEWL